jgi:protein TonB
MRLSICLVLLFCCLRRAGAQSALPAPTDSTVADTDRIPRTRIVTHGDSTFKYVEIEATFPGGSRAWLQYLNSHLRYPNKAVKKKIQGTVVVQFIVDKDGSVIDVHAISGPELLQEAAVEVVKTSPPWRHAIQNNRAVKAYKKQPITFSFPDK